MYNIRFIEEQEMRKFFGKRLQAARRLANLSQKGLAYRLQTGQDTISNYERGKVIPNILTVFQIAQVLGLDVSYFFPDEPFTNLPTEDREILALIKSLSPKAYEFVLLFLRYFTDYQRRRFLVEDVFSSQNKQERFLIFLEQNLHELEEKVAGNPQTPSAEIRGLTDFICILLLALELENENHQAKLMPIIDNRWVALLHQVIVGQTTR